MDQDAKLTKVSVTRRSMLKGMAVGAGALGIALLGDGLKVSDRPCGEAKRQGPGKCAGSAMGAVRTLTNDGLFRGQSPAFLAFLQDLATQADSAERQ